MGSMWHMRLNSGGDDALNFFLKKRVILDNGGLIGEFVLFNEFLDDAHELGLVGLGLFEVFLHGLNFHVD